MGGGPAPGCGTGVFFRGGEPAAGLLKAMESGKGALETGGERLSHRVREGAGGLTLQESARVGEYVAGSLGLARLSPPEVQIE